MTTEQIENLTMQDVANAKTAAAEARKTRSGVSTVVSTLAKSRASMGMGARSITPKRASSALQPKLELSIDCDTP